MNVSLEPRQQQFVEQQVRTGRFSTAEDVVRAALDQFEVNQEFDEVPPVADLDELRAKLASGLAQAARGESKPCDPEEIWADVERLYAEERKRG